MSMVFSEPTWKNYIIWLTIVPIFREYLRFLTGSEPLGSKRLPMKSGLSLSPTKSGTMCICTFREAKTLRRYAALPCEAYGFYIHPRLSIRGVINILSSSPQANTKSRAEKENEAARPLKIARRLISYSRRSAFEYSSNFFINPCTRQYSRIFICLGFARK